MLQQAHSQCIHKPRMQPQGPHGHLGLEQQPISILKILLLFMGQPTQEAQFPQFTTPMLMLV